MNLKICLALKNIFTKREERTSNLKKKVKMRSIGGSSILKELILPKIKGIHV